MIIDTTFAIYVHYLFSYNINIEWHEIFKCLDVHLTPESICVMDKKIFNKWLILAKLSLKISKIIKFKFIFVIAIHSNLYLFYKRIYFKIINDILLLISMTIWLTISFVFYMSETVTSIFIFFPNYLLSLLYKFHIFY